MALKHATLKTKAFFWGEGKKWAQNRHIIIWEKQIAKLPNLDK